MGKYKKLGLIFGLVALISCGQDVILVRPHLDSPSQHVENGRLLLEMGKVDDACREFDRAIELDPKMVLAYIDLGIALGVKGDVEGGLNRLRQAEALAASAEERSAVKAGFDRFNRVLERKGAKN